MLGEAGGRNARQRYHDLLGVASAISNRARVMGITPEQVVANTKEFSAYGKELPPGVEAYRGLAEAALNEVNVLGPTHTGTFYATPARTKNLPRGLTKVAQTDAHVYFDDPRDQPINSAIGTHKVSRDVKAQIADQVAARGLVNASTIDDASSRLAAQDRAAEIAARDITSRMAPNIDAVTAASSTPVAMSRSVPAASEVGRIGQVGTGLAMKAAMASPMQNVSLSKTSRSVPSLSDFDNRFSAGFTNDISSPLNRTASTQSDLTGTQNARLSNALRTGQIQSQLSQTRSVPSLTDFDTTASTTRSVPSFADKKAQAYAGAATALNAQREGYTTAGSPTGAALSAATAVGDDGTPGRTTSVSKSAPANSGFGTAGASGFGVGGSTEAGGWGDTARGMFGSISDAVGNALGGLNAVGTGANLSSPVSSIGQTGQFGTGLASKAAAQATADAATRTATRSVPTNSMQLNDISRMSPQDTIAAARTTPSLDDTKRKSEDLSANQKSQYASALNATTGALTGTVGTIDNTTASISDQPLNNATRDFQRKQNVVTPTVSVADDITPSYEAPTIATAYADDVTPTVPSADVTPTSSRTTRTRTAVSVPDQRDTLSDVNAGGATGLSAVDRNAPDGLTARSNLGPRAATMAGSMIGSMIGGPWGALAGALAGNAIGRSSGPAGGTGGFFGGLFGGTRSADGLSGSGPGGKGPGGTGGGSKGSRGPGASSSGSRGGSNKGEQGSRR
ncbi:hypothetical protein LJR030_003142 [Rhizobium sp. LjRoot30]|uniref:hypothetical protein n=1 Tax=Rhizobium sp. LjRoot30 TaxID=3342320 RepID=UPI003ED0CBFC